MAVVVVVVVILIVAVDAVAVLIVVVVVVLLLVVVVVVVASPTRDSKEHEIRGPRFLHHCIGKARVTTPCSQVLPRPRATISSPLHWERNSGRLRGTRFLHHCIGEERAISPCSHPCSRLVVTRCDAVRPLFDLLKNPIAETLLGN